MKYFYHGSPVKVDELRPSPSTILNNEPVVFATNSKVFALVHIISWHDRDFEFGKFAPNLPLTLRENYPGAFAKYKGRKGFIYYVNSKLFKQDPRTGMKEEYISRNTVPIIKTEIINDAWEALQDLAAKKKLVLISWEKYEKLMARYVKNH